MDDARGIEAGEALARTESRPYASIPSRFGARFIDGTIISLAMAGLAIALGFTSADEAPPATFTAAFFLAALAYEVGLTAARGQTLGKMLLRIRVVQIEDGFVPGLGRAAIRWGVPAAVGYALSFSLGDDLWTGLLTCLVYMWAIFNPRRQGVHDIAARTIVVKETPPPLSLI